MSIFSFFGDIAKPGKGVSKDEAEKKPFFKFWEIFFRKFWSLMLLNVTVILCLIPFAALSFVIFSLLRGSSWSVSDNLNLAIIFSLCPFMLCGPVLGAAQKITREFAREEPVFVWSDFFSCMKKNIKQPLVMSILAYLVFSSLSVAIPSYYYSNLGFIRYILFGICILIFVVFLFMQYYLFTMAVTFDLSLKQLYKNAAILSTVTLVKNLIITAVLAVCVGVIFLMLLYTSAINILFPLLLMFYCLIGFAFISYVISFVTFPTLKKYIIDPYYAENTDETSDSIFSEENSENDSGAEDPSPESACDKEEDSHDEPNDAIEAQADGSDEPKNIKESEYVYHNGRMVLRSVAKKEVLFTDTVASSKSTDSEKNKNQ